MISHHLFKRELAKEHLTKILMAIYVYAFDPVWIAVNSK